MMPRYGWTFHPEKIPVNVYSLLLKMAIEMVDIPIENGIFSIVFCKRLPEGNRQAWQSVHMRFFSFEAEANHFFGLPPDSISL